MLLWGVSGEVTAQNVCLCCCEVWVEKWRLRMSVCVVVRCEWRSDGSECLFVLLWGVSGEVTAVKLMVACKWGCLCCCEVWVEKWRLRMSVCWHRGWLIIQWLTTVKIKRLHRVLALSPSCSRPRLFTVNQWRSLRVLRWQETGCSCNSRRLCCCRLLISC